MNLVDCVVTQILSDPYIAYDKWWVKVKYNSYGREDVSTIMADTIEEARLITIGTKFLS